MTLTYLRVSQKEGHAGSWGHSWAVISLSSFPLPFRMSSFYCCAVFFVFFCLRCLCEGHHLGSVPLLFNIFFVFGLKYRASLHSWRFRTQGACFTISWTSTLVLDLGVHLHSVPVSVPMICRARAQAAFVDEAFVSARCVKVLLRG